MTNQNMTESERQEVNELIGLLHQWSETRNLTILEVLGRMEMVKQSLWFNTFGDPEHFTELDD